MGDLKTFWADKDQPFSGTDTAGAGVISRGNDPNAEGDAGPAGLADFWPVRALPESTNASMKESSNSVSGLPALPNRFEPAADAPEMPTLQDRIPGTIDKQ